VTLFCVDLVRKLGRRSPFGLRVSEYTASPFAEGGCVDDYCLQAFGPDYLSVSMERMRMAASLGGSRAISR
jgi:hypothetical protein